MAKRLYGNPMNTPIGGNDFLSRAVARNAARIAERALGKSDYATPKKIKVARGDRKSAEAELACALADVCQSYVSNVGNMEVFRYRFWEGYVKTVDRYDGQFPGIKEAFNSGLKRFVPASALENIDATKWVGD